MSAPTRADVLELLREIPLLRDDQMRALAALALQVPGPGDPIRALVRCGWLTIYQAQELLTGRGRGLLLSDYVLLEPLGEGSSARIFKARHQATGGLVALKVIRGPLTEAAVERLRREHWAGTRLEHPNIRHTHGSGCAAGSYFLVMEHVEGRSLGRLVREQGPLPIGRACDYARQAARGLDHALRRGLVHRDIKPSNLLLVHGTGLVKILDLGLACPSGIVPGAGVPAAGTPDYVAPEQVSDPGRADPRSDIYSLGCTLYHLLAGRPPFPGGTLEEKLLRHRRDTPEAVQVVRPEVPRRLGEVVRRMMARSPRDRWPTPAAAEEALEPFAEPGDCDSRFVLEWGEEGLAGLDPGQATAVLAPAGPHS